MKRKARIRYALKMIRSAIETGEKSKPKPDLILGCLKEAELSLEKAEKKE